MTNISVVAGQGQQDLPRRIPTLTLGFTRWTPMAGFYGESTLYPTERGSYIQKAATGSHSFDFSTEKGFSAVSGCAISVPNSVRKSAVCVGKLFREGFQPCGGN